MSGSSLPFLMAKILCYKTPRALTEILAASFDLVRAFGPTIRRLSGADDNVRSPSCNHK